MARGVDGVSETEVVLLPLRGVGPIRFGMTRQEVVRILGPPDHVLNELSLHYRALGNLGFDADDRCDFVGSAPEDVLVEGIRLEGRFCDVADQLSARGHTLTDAKNGVDFDHSYCDALGLTLVRQAPFDRSARICAVQAWVPGYWERQRPFVRSD